MKKINNFLVLAISLIVVALIISMTLIAINWKSVEGDKSTISTSGTSTIQVTASKVSLYIGYEARADTAEEAQQNNTDVSNAVIEAIRDLGVAESNIETTNYNVAPEYDWTEDGRVLKGYLATHTIKITTQDLDKVGEYIDVAIGAGANRINRLNYELTDEEQESLKAQALKEATQNARSKAEAIALGSGTRIVRVKSITDTYSYSPWRYTLEYAVVGSSSAEDIEIPTQVETGSVTVNANINAIFEIA